MFFSKTKINLKRYDICLLPLQTENVRRYYKRRVTNKFCKGENNMLWTILVILLVLWVLGFATSAVGSMIHLLLVVALVIFVIQMLTGRRSV